MSETDNSSLPISESRIRLEVLRRREIKWLDMIGHWDSYMRGNYKKVRERCRKGIPGSIRGQAWSHLCGAEMELKRRADTATDFKRLCVSHFSLALKSIRLMLKSTVCKFVTFSLNRLNLAIRNGLTTSKRIYIGTSRLTSSSEARTSGSVRPSCSGCSKLTPFSTLLMVTVRHR